MKAIAVTAVLAILCVVARAATITAASTSLAHVSNAIASASSGDVVAIPAGSSTWTASLLVTNSSLTIIGAGTNYTILTRTNGSLFDLRPINGIVRVSSVSFVGGWTDPLIELVGRNEAGSGNPIYSFRIDRCRFTQGKRSINPNYYVLGLVDQCTFSNCNIAVGVTGDNSASWARPITIGTTNTICIERCAFMVDNSAPSEPNEQIYHQNGGRTVTRFNTFDGSSASSYNFLPFESHGNWSSSATVSAYSTNALEVRGQPLIEIYGNTFAAHHSYRMIYLRGGMSIIASNVLTYASGGAPSSIELTEEETWQTSFFTTLRTNWPAHDGITNSFFWGNTLNGSSTAVALNYTNSAYSIAENRDYWKQAPNSTNGSPAGLYNGFTMLAYPHPRATAEDGAGPITIGTARVGSIQSPQ